MNTISQYSDFIYNYGIEILFGFMLVIALEKTALLIRLKNGLKAGFLTAPGISMKPGKFAVISAVGIGFFSLAFWLYNIINGRNLILFMSRGMVLAGYILIQGIFYEAGQVSSRIFYDKEHFFLSGFLKNSFKKYSWSAVQNIEIIELLSGRAKVQIFITGKNAPIQFTFASIDKQAFEAMANQCGVKLQFRARAHE